MVFMFRFCDLLPLRNAQKQVERTQHGNNRAGHVNSGWYGKENSKRKETRQKVLRKSGIRMIKPKLLNFLTSIVDISIYINNNLFALKKKNKTKNLHNIK